MAAKWQQSKRWANDGPVQSANVFDRITAKIIADLEKGDVPWLRPWKAEKANLDPNIIWPRNGSSGHWYAGGNVFLLWCHMHDIKKQSEPALFVTFKQARACGGYVKRGEKGCLVVGYRKGEREVENEAGDIEKKSYMGAFGHTVFHVSQCENLKLPKFDNPKPAVGLTDDEAWQDFLTALNVDLRHGGPKAYYHPVEDYVQMPTANAFYARQGYKAVALHEFTHWTGHKGRLDRDQTGFKGTETYAFEELIAELGAAFLCAKLGIVHKELRHAGYISIWIDVLKRDTRAVVRAASKAKAAAEYIEELTKECMNDHRKSARKAARSAANGEKPARRRKRLASNSLNGAAQVVEKVKGKAANHDRRARGKAAQGQRARRGGSRVRGAGGAQSSPRQVD